jgi:hypothetical protein
MHGTLRLLRDCSCLLPEFMKPVGLGETNWGMQSRSAREQ